MRVKYYENIIWDFAPHNIREALDKNREVFDIPASEYKHLDYISDKFWQYVEIPHLMRKAHLESFLLDWTPYLIWRPRDMDCDTEIRLWEKIPETLLDLPA